MAAAVGLVGLLSFGAPAVASASSTPLPVIASFTGSPTSLTYKGGTVTLKATLKYATSCTLSVSPGIKGLPKTFACTTAVSQAITVPATSSQNPLSYTFHLVAKNTTGSTPSAPDVVIGEGALPPNLSFTPSTISFQGTTAVKESTAPVTLTVHNNAKTSQSITAWGIAASSIDKNDFVVYSPTAGCNAGAPLGPGQSCTLLVQFMPLAAGTRTASIYVYDASWGSSGASVNVNTSGTGAYGLASLSKATITFPDQAIDTTSTPLTETITNSSSSVVLYIAPEGQWTIAGSNAGDFYFVLGSGTSCSGASLNPGQSCTFQAEFGPTGTGTRTAKVSIVDNTQAGQTLMTLAGTSQYATATFQHINAPGGSVVAWRTSGGIPTYNFGTASPGTIYVLMSNTSKSVSLHIDPLGGFTGADPNDFQIGNNGCSSYYNTEVVGGSCYFEISFTPTTGGLRTATLDIFDNTNGGSWEINLTGGTGSPG
jgi:hypothetical protein